MNPFGLNQSEVDAMLEIPQVSVRRQGIRWPRRQHVVRRDLSGWVPRWVVVVVVDSDSTGVVEARFFRHRKALRLAVLLNRIETQAVNT